MSEQSLPNSETKSRARGRSRAKPKVTERPLLDLSQGDRLQATFKVLASSTRLRILHALVREGELCVGEIAAALRMKPQAVSNQLQRLVDKGILAARRNGTQIHYRIVDPCVVSLLDRGICLTEDLPIAFRGPTAKARRGK
jgi:DNA-binding transcriptional ArsR family regulator